MANQRMVNTKFWVDNYIVTLKPIEKLLFLYFITNPFTNISGVYEMPLAQIELNTKLKAKEIVKILIKFEKDEKIFYENGWVAIKNFAKNQVDSAKIRKGIEDGLKIAPTSLVDRISGVKNRISYITESNIKESKVFSSKDTDWDTNPHSPTYGLPIKKEKIKNK